MKAVIIVDREFQDEEYIYPYYRLQEAGFEVDVASKTGEIMYGKYGIPAKVTIKTSALLADNYDLIFVPGGTESPDRMRQDEYILKFIREMNQANKPIGAICHGPWVLISAGITNGRNMTCYIGMKDDLINAGAHYVDAPVVIDNNIVTAPHYRNNGDLMKNLLGIIC